MPFPFSFWKAPAGGGGDPAPTVSSADPDLGDIAGHHIGLMTITGTGFVSGSTVTIGGTSATGVIFDGATQLRCNPPAKSAGLHTIRVTNPDTQYGELTNGYRAWNPSQVSDVRLWSYVHTGITTKSGDATKIEKWLDNGPNSRCWSYQIDATRPIYSAAGKYIEFATGAESVRLYTDATTTSIHRATGFTAGYSVFAAVEYTNSDAVSSSPSIRAPQTLFGDYSGWGSVGFSAGDVAVQQFNHLGFSPVIRPGGGTNNDGAWRMLGATFSSGGDVKCYSGNAQLGATHSTTFDVGTSGFDVLGVGYQDLDGYIGKLRAIVVFDGEISGTDRGYLHKWMRMVAGVAA